MRWKERLKSERDARRRFGKLKSPTKGDRPATIVQERFMSVAGQAKCQHVYWWIKYNNVYAQIFLENCPDLVGAERPALAFECLEKI